MGKLKRSPLHVVFGLLLLTGALIGIAGFAQYHSQTTTTSEEGLTARDITERARAKLDALYRTYLDGNLDQSRHSLEESISNSNDPQLTPAAQAGFLWLSYCRRKRPANPVP